MARTDRGISLARRCMLGWIAAAALVGCAAKTGAERATDYPLAERTRYAWVTEDLVLIQLGGEQPNVRTEANEKRLRKAIDEALGERGYTKVAHDEADVLVAFSVGTTVRYRLEGSESASIAGLEPGTKQTKGTLNIYMIDRAGKREVWHGWTTRWLTKGDEPDAVVREAVATVMAEFPGGEPGL